ncbi:hypothetical protein J437_LFUL004734 [Ladona fulva]|uniref:DNA-directed DNA polymerase n=1 Tax=Ladona fulva TaxID=123851 RepID=A0A8K0K1H9_LADFU|nr:hypothetical protein J437_LFUL004734 [Ladona fulva]
MEAFFSQLTASEILRVFRTGVLKTRETLEIAYDEVIRRHFTMGEIVDVDDFSSLLSSVLESNTGEGNVRPEVHPLQLPDTPTATTPLVHQVDGGEYFSIISENRVFLKKFKLWGNELNIRVHQIPEGSIPLEWYGAMLHSLLLTLKAGVDGGARGGMSIRNESYPQRDINISYRRCDQIEPQVVLNRIEKVIQSNEDFFLNGLLSVSFQYVDIPHGRGKSKLPPFVDFDSYCFRRKSTVVVSDDEDLCLPRAICLGISRHEDSRNVFKTLHNINHAQRLKALALCDAAGVVIGENGGGVEEITLLQVSIPGYKITVFGDRRGKDVIFEGPNLTPDGEQRKTIDLIFYAGHYNLITSVTGAFNCNYYCRPCRFPYNNDFRHKCNQECVRCRSSPPCKSSSPMKMCGSCKREFLGERRFENHLLPLKGKGKSTCNSTRSCPQCLFVYAVGKHGGHTCGNVFCSTCKKHTASDHRCYMGVETRKDLRGPHIFVFYDIECRQDDEFHSSSSTDVFLHTPNLLVSNSCCDACISQDVEVCDKCGIREKLYSSDDPVRDFVKYIESLGNIFRSVTCVAHNAKGYDENFVLKSILENTSWKPQVIMNGTKLPQALDLQDPMVKGFFPHFFNTKENSRYVGPIPAPEMYGVDSMSTKDKAAFLSWHGEISVSGYVFSMEDETRKYCDQDVRILRYSCLRFRDIFLASTGVDPFREAVTIAGACTKVFRRNFLKAETIAIISPGGYGMADRQSRKAI